jgi:sterol desaturase/sphingolipid hydroxylase (fatty acid hydroxylase superfamily)
MGNLNNIGNIQSSVGKADADISMIGAYCVAVFMVLLAIFFAVTAFTPRKPSDCLDDNKTERCQHKTRKFGVLGISVILILVACLVIFLAKWWKKEVYTNKTAAQIGGTMAELNIVNQLFNN